MTDLIFHLLTFKVLRISLFSAVTENAYISVRSLDFLLPLNIEDWECGNTRPKPPLTDHFSERRLPWPGWLRAFSAGGEGEDGDGGHYGGHLGEDEEGDSGRHGEGSRLWIPGQGTVGWA